MTETRRALVLDINPALYAGGGSGIGRYVRDLVAALESDPGAPPAWFSYSRNLRSRARALARRERLVELPLSSRATMLLTIVGARLRWNLGALYGRPALFHSPIGSGPWLPRSRLLLTIHDLTFLDHPEWHTARTVSFMRNTVPAAVARADLVICDSDHVRRKVIERLHVPEERTTTVPLAPDDVFRPETEEAARDHLARRFGLEPPFLLHVGSIEPRKNHARLIEAFEEVRRRGLDVLLVLVAAEGWRNADILDRIERSPARGAIRRLADVTDRDLVALYSACTVFTLPSLEEGFGLPLAEAMACGAACVAAENSSLAEIGRDGTVLIPAEDPTALARALIDLCADPAARAAWRSRALERASRYRRGDWIARMMEIYRRLTDGGRAFARSSAQ